MGLFDFLNKPSMFEEVKNCRNTPGGVLLDVRSESEYNTGHIPGSINVPVNKIEDAEEFIKSKDSLVCIYCASGARAKTAELVLKRKGYTNVKNLGGIKKYHGKIER